MPETAVRCVRPVVRKSSTSPGGIPASSPSTRAGTSARWLAGRWATASRIEARRASVARQAAPAAAGRLGWPARGHRGGQVARVVDGRQPAGEADPLPEATRSQASSPNTRTGWCRPTRDPHQHPVAEATLDPPWVARHRARQGHQGALLGGRRDRAHAHRLGPDQRHHPDPGGDGQHRQRGEGRPPPPRPEDGHQQRRGRDEGEHPDDARPPPHEQRPGPRRQAEERQPQVRRGHSVTYGRELGQGDLADPVHVEELVDRGEGAVLGPPGQDRLGRHRADVGQRLEGDLVGGVEVDQRGDRGGAAGHRGRDTRRLGQPDQDLLAVDQDPGEVEAGQVDAVPGATGRLERVDHPRAGVEHGDARTTYLARDVDRHRAASSARRPRRRRPARHADQVAGRARLPPARPPRAGRRPAPTRPSRPVPPAPASATTASCAAPRVSRPRAACRPGTGTAAGRTSGAGSRPGRTRVCVDSSGSTAARPRTTASSAPSSSSRRATASS